jgi:hypothetical protein
MSNNSEWNIISSAYCLNLERNTQRWIDSQREFHSVGLIDVERVNCIESMDNRFISFNQSHYNTVKRGYETGNPFAIFEDDILFDARWKHIAEATNQRPADWDLLYLGGNFHGDWLKPWRYSSHLAILPNAWQSHAIIYSLAGAKFVLDNFNPDIITAENPVYDEWLRVNLMPHGKTFMLNPMSCHQRPGYSDIWQRPADYSPVHYDGNKYLSRL